MDSFIRFLDKHLQKFVLYLTNISGSIYIYFLWAFKKDALSNFTFHVKWRFFRLVIRGRPVSKKINKNAEKMQTLSSRDMNYLLFHVFVVNCNDSRFTLLKCFFKEDFILVQDKVCFDTKCTCLLSKQKKFFFLYYEKVIHKLNDLNCR